MVVTEISENNSNIFYINSEIGETFHKDFIVPFMREMKVQKKLRDWSMHIYIYSPGWDLFWAIELISLIEKCKCVKKCYTLYTFTFLSIIYRK